MLLDSSRGSILPLTCLALAVIESIKVPVPILVKDASGFGGKEIVIPVIGYVCADNCTENNKIRNTNIFIAVV